MSVHDWYVAAAYGVSAIVLIGMIILLLADGASRRRELAALEAGGVRRRSDKQAAEPV